MHTLVHLYLEYRENLSKAGILAFTTETLVTMPSSLVSMDKNKFHLKSNTYTENYAGQKTSIVDLRGIRRVYITSDTYKDNGGQYLEVLTKYGTITSVGYNEAEGSDPGTWKLGAYYISSGDPNTITLRRGTVAGQSENFYPLGPLNIENSFFVDTTGLTFDNNAMQELKIAQISILFASGAIRLSRVVGKVNLNSLTIKNYKGMDVTKIQVITGNSK